MFSFLKNLGPIEIFVLILIVILFFFGSKIAIGVGKASGKTFKEIKKVKKSFTEAIEGSDTPKEVSK